MSIIYQLPPPAEPNLMDFWQGVTTLLDKYGIETVAILILLILLLRTVPGALKAVSGVLQTRATAAATEQVTQIQNDALVLEILRKQVDNNAESNKTHAETNKILIHIQTEFAKSREEQVINRQTNDELKIAIKEFNAETKALRMDVKNWPNTVDGTLAGAITAIETLRLSNEKEHGDVIKILEHIQKLQIETHTWVGVMYKLVMRPTPPTEPSSAPPAPNVTPLHADGGAKVPDELPKASGL